jgi:hypothetical protein
MRYLGMRLEGTGEWKLHEQLLILTGNRILSSVRWAGRMRTNMHTGFLENIKDSEHLEELGIDGRIILERMLIKLDGCVNVVMNLQIPLSSGNLTS